LRDIYRIGCLMNVTHVVQSHKKGQVFVFEPVDEGSGGNLVVHVRLRFVFWIDRSQHRIGLLSVDEL
jgi:hypothetical protein